MGGRSRSAAAAVGCEAGQGQQHEHITPAYVGTYLVATHRNVYARQQHFPFLSAQSIFRGLYKAARNSGRHLSDCITYRLMQQVIRV